VERILKIIVRALLIAGVIAALWFAMQSLVAKQRNDLAMLAKQPRPVPTVQVEPVLAETWPRYLYSIGSFTAKDDVSVTNEIEGKVTAIYFSSGQKVSAGDVLVSLDASVDAAELQALQAEQRLNELQFERSEKLLREHTISKADFDIAAARRDESIATARAKAASLDKKTIRAPFSGILGIRQVDLGQFLDAGSEIVTLQSIVPIYLDFGTPERYIHNISDGLEIEAEVHAYPGEVFRGRLIAVAPGIDRATRNMYMRAEFDNADGRLRPGMFAEIRGLVPAEDERLTIPETAVTYTPYGNSVFVVEAGDGGTQVSRRMIETGEIRHGRIAVLKGLDPDDIIVSAGHNKLRNGMTVQTSNSDRLSSATAE